MSYQGDTHPWGLVLFFHKIFLQPFHVVFTDKSGSTEDTTMATGADQVAGMGMVGLAGFIFSYYTLWVIVLPFVEPDQWLHQFFPDRFYAIAVPLVAGVLGLVFIGLFMVIVTIKKNAKKVKKS
ncbi:dolichol phosphate-mannose biosynthesis regulatory protein-like isoform X1 [Haliotis asinina]|uniref:dolichol phosphate-mannose biosynthesis regulatory protein-like isoform X1 n=2 Tax=Haliotis asinina TaxID=109174 RepID=UPI0035321757